MTGLEATLKLGINSSSPSVCLVTSLLSRWGCGREDSGDGKGRGHCWLQALRPGLGAVGLG